MKKVYGYRYPITLSGIITELGTGVTTADEIDERYGKSNGVWTESTGIERIHKFHDGDDVLQAVERSCRSVLEMADFDLSDVNGLWATSSTPTTPYLMPSFSEQLGERLGLGNMQMHTVGMGCAGGVQALMFACNQMVINKDTGMESTFLLVSGEQCESVLNQDDVTTYPLFSDGCTAIALTTHERPGYVIKRARSKVVEMDSDLLHSMEIRNQYWSNDSGSCLFEMKGKDVYRFATRIVPSALLDLLDLDAIPEHCYFIPHQASRKIIEKIGKQLSLPDNRVYSEGIKEGNCLTSSVYYGLEHAFRTGMMESGTDIILGGFGAGIQVSAAYLSPYQVD